MTKVGENRLDDTQMECLVAALLTIASAGAETYQPKSIVDRYRKILERLQDCAGSYVNPPVA
jgi:hypothetical protein